MTDDAPALFAQGRFEDAIRAWTRALRRDPGLLQAYAGIGEAYLRLGLARPASMAFTDLVKRVPHSPEAHYNLGVALAAAGKPAEAAAAYREAVRLRPDFFEAWSDLGIPLYHLGRFDEALAAQDSALRLRPQSSGAHGNRANALFALGRLEEALHGYQAALALDPANAEAATSLGNLHKELGRHAAALKTYRMASHAAPLHAPAASNLILALHYADGVTPGEILAEARDYARRFEPPPGPALVAAPADQRRRLRIGYVSGDLRRHPVGYFLSPVLTSHDRAAFEIFCYSANPIVDDMTRHLHGLADHWRSLASLSDDAAARLIAEDRLDLLVDLSGHTAFNRLPVFARRPAPVQASWLGFWGTTGLSAIDAVLSDDTTIQPGEERFYREEVVRLPRGRFCYAPPDYAPEPALRDGPPTFGSFNNLSKVGPAVRRLWRNILRQVPDSRLVLKWSTLADPALRAALSAEFAETGIDPARLDLRGPSAHRDMLAEYGDVDVALDPFPFGGGLTSCEALWMGVPVVTMPGVNPASRQTLGVLRGIGREEWGAASAEAYVRIARDLAADRDRLNQLRRGLRPALAGSPLCDGPGFTRGLEEIYRSLISGRRRGSSRPPSRRS
jgi:predicted O-linked N-acetylglucosamine transferase (SPINDLY family)